MAYHTGPKIVTDGLVLCLDAADRNSYPGSGSTWYDLSGENNHASISATFSNSYNGIFIFSSSEASVNVDSFIRNNSDYTFHCLFYVNALDGGFPFNLMNLPNSDNQSDGFWAHMSYGGNFLWRLEDSVNGEKGGNAVAPTPFSSGLWYSLTTVVKTNTLLFYLNGQLISTISTQFAWANLRTDRTAYLTIGKGYGQSFPLNGSMSLFHMYNRSLSADEISQNYNATKGRFGL